MTSEHPFNNLTASGGGGLFVKWEEVGQQVVGTITLMEVVRDHFAAIDDKNAAMHPRLTIDTEMGDQIVTCSQSQLRSKIIEAHQTTGLEVGDKIAIVYTGIEGLAGGKTMKTFDVVVKTPEAPTAPAAAKKAKPSAADLI
jgi:hypothetical protein